MANQDIRTEAKKSKVYLYEVADKMGICDMTLMRKLRYELSDKQKEEIVKMIYEIAESKK